MNLDKVIRGYVKDASILRRITLIILTISTTFYLIKINYLTRYLESVVHIFPIK